MLLALLPHCRSWEHGSRRAGFTGTALDEHRGGMLAHATSVSKGSDRDRPTDCLTPSDAGAC